MDSIKKNKRKSVICWTVAFVLATAYLIISCLPFIFMVLNSFKEKFEMLVKGVFSLPDTFYIDNYKEVLRRIYYIFHEQCHCIGNIFDFITVHCSLCLLSFGKI